MRTIRTKVYKFNELTKQGQQKAIENLSDINVDSEHWFSALYDDAENIGLKLTGFEFNSASFVRNVTGEFITSAGEVVETILQQHGASCDTYKLAQRYKNAFQLNSSEENDEILSDREDLFLRELLQQYSELLQNEYEYQTTEEAIKETIEANDYEFYANGKLISA